MCGIIGLAGRFQGLPPDVGAAFTRARDLMIARGPDGAGEVVLDDSRVGPVRLGHRRLSIQDLSDNGAQPMWSDCGGYVLTYNGEVYNAPALRGELEALGRRFRSGGDTEVIVNGYAQWGAEVVRRLHGIFAFAIWDVGEGALFAARDRLGVKPFCYAASEDGVAFASDMRCLDALGLAGGLDMEALGAYLMLGYAPTPLSIRKGVAKLEAGCALSWRPGRGARLSRYWNAPVATDEDGPTSLDELSELIDKVSAEQLLSDVPVGLFLSGGLDSSLIASSVRKVSDQLSALTVGYPMAPGEDEAPIAVRTAEMLGLPITRLDLDPQTTPGYMDRAFAALDEPLGYSAIVSQMAVSDATSGQGYKVALSGDGGDEIFGGYRWYDRPATVPPAYGGRFGLLAARMLGPFAPAAIRRNAQCRFAGRSMLHAHLHGVFPAFHPDEIADVAQGMQPDLVEEVAISALRRHDAPDLPLKRRLQRIDLMTFCLDSILPKVDRTSMATGLEVRPPLLDHRIVEWGLSRPVSDLCDSAPKGAIRALLARRGLGFLNDEKKRGFSLKGVSQLSQKAMSQALDCAEAVDIAPLRRKPASRVDRAAPFCKMKIQTMYFFSQWLAAGRVRDVGEVEAKAITDTAGANIAEK